METHSDNNSHEEVYEAEEKPDAAHEAHECCHAHASTEKSGMTPASSKSVLLPWVIATGVLALYIIVSQFVVIDVKLRRQKSAQNTAVAPRVSTSATPAGAVQNQTSKTDAALAAKVLPAEGVTLPVAWKDFGRKLIETGVIDEQKFTALYAQRGGLGQEETKLLTGSDNGNIKITQANAQFLLNVLWAFGLGNKNTVLEKGPMQDKQYGGADKFASTGAWTLAKGNTMDHYSKHPFVTLTPAQQQLVERVSQNVYRPCCGNSTYFPDCNHGMAMLGLLELMASQGVDEEEMYRAALAVNSYWFPDTYVTIAKYMESQGTPWNNVSPQEMLGANYSSGQGYRKIVEKVSPVKTSGGGGCGV